MRYRAVIDGKIFIESDNLESLVCLIMQLDFKRVEIEKYE
jgi:hypothetical protein